MRRSAHRPDHWAAAAGGPHSPRRARSAPQQPATDQHVIRMWARAVESASCHSSPSGRGDCRMSADDDGAAPPAEQRAIRSIAVTSSAAAPPTRWRTSKTAHCREAHQQAIIRLAHSMVGASAPASRFIAASMASCNCASSPSCNLRDAAGLGFPGGRPVRGCVPHPCGRRAVRAAIWLRAAVPPSRSRWVR